MIVFVDNKFLDIKFGLFYLMRLQKFSKEYSDREFIEQLSSLFGISELIRKEDWLEAFNQSFSPDVNPKVNSFVEMIDYVQKEQDFSSLYSSGVGEMGLPPDVFYFMTPAEIDLAYQGYLKKQELQANLTILALRKARDKEAKLFNLLGGEGYSVISSIEREQQLKALGLK